VSDAIFNKPLLFAHQLLSPLEFYDVYVVHKFSFWSLATSHSIELVQCFGLHCIHQLQGELDGGSV
jgi:hypothetical protein